MKLYSLYFPNGKKKHTETQPNPIIA